MDFLQKEPNYYHCLGPDRGASQIHEQEEEAAPLMRCHSCGFRTCITHQVAWHDGQTCEDYDLWKTENIHRDEENAASEAEIRMSTKPCSSCMAPSVKINGCDHVKCKFSFVFNSTLNDLHSGVVPACGYEFCWVCLRPWATITHGAYHNGA